MKRKILLLTTLLTIFSLTSGFNFIVRDTSSPSPGACYPVQQIPYPTNVKWDTNVVGKATWDAVPGAGYYEVSFNGEKIITFETSHIFTNKLNYEGSNWFYVHACFEEGESFWQCSNELKKPKKPAGTSTSGNQTSNQNPNSSDQPSSGSSSTSSKGHWNTYPDGAFPHNVNSKVYSKKNTWVEEDGNWYYQNQYGIRAAGWLDNGGNRYHMSADGSMDTGWLTISPNRYYFDEDDGHMLYSTSRDIDGTVYKFDSNGCLVAGWMKDKYGTYYIKSDGCRATDGLFFVGTDTYYADEEGYIVTDAWIEIDGYDRYFYSNGKMAKNTKIDGYVIDEYGYAH